MPGSDPDVALDVAVALGCPPTEMRAPRPGADLGVNRALPLGGRISFPARPGRHSRARPGTEGVREISARIDSRPCPALSEGELITSPDLAATPRRQLRFTFVREPVRDPGEDFGENDGRHRTVLVHARGTGRRGHSAAGT